MLKKNFSSGLLSANTKGHNKYFLFDSIKPNIPPKELVSRRRIQKLNTNNIIKLYHPLKSFNSYGKNHTYFFNNKENSLHSAKIYLKLEKSEEIAKIVNEEEKKRYFNREFHLSKTVNRDELKRRIGNTIPTYHQRYKKTRKNKYKSMGDKDKLHSSLNNYRIKSIKNLININNKLIHNYKYQGENEIKKSKMNYDAVTSFLQNMDEQKKIMYDEMEKKFLEKKK